jgi:hypothetical protein
LSSGMYWLVTSFIASCATIPPRKAAVVGKLEKPPLALRGSLAARFQARTRKSMLKGQQVGATRDKQLTYTSTMLSM